MLSESAELPVTYIAQLVDHMWVNDVLIMSLPFLVGIVLLKCFPELFTAFFFEKQQHGSSKRQDQEECAGGSTDGECSVGEASLLNSEMQCCSQVQGAMSELDLVSRGVPTASIASAKPGPELDLVQELEIEVWARQENDVMAHCMARLQADLLADIAADDEEILYADMVEDLAALAACDA